MAQCSILRRSGGSGIVLPDTIAAGESPIFFIIGFESGYDVWEDTTHKFKVLKNGVYTIKYNVRSSANGEMAYCRLMRNGVLITGSQIQSDTDEESIYKSLAVTLNANDIVVKQLHGMLSQNDHAVSDYLLVSMLSNELQTGLNNIIVKI